MGDEIEKVMLDTAIHGESIYKVSADGIKVFDLSDVYIQPTDEEIRQHILEIIEKCDGIHLVFKSTPKLLSDRVETMVVPLRDDEVQSMYVRQ